MPHTTREHEYWSCLALVHTRGLGLRTVGSLLGYYGSAGGAVANVRAWTGQGLVRQKVVTAFLGEGWRKAATRERSLAREQGLKVLLWSDGAYPSLLRQIPDAPPVLYYRGDVSLLQRPVVGMVGARDCSRYGLDMAGRLAGGLSRAGVTIASGFAQGIDRQAHASALTGSGSTIGVLGTGLDLVYPASNRDLWGRMSEAGLLLTEFSPGTPPDAHNFPRRNRIISGISLGVVVVQAASRSGSLITAMQALDQNREVFAVPGPVDSLRHDGCHELIRQGAFLARSAEDVLVELEPLLKAWRAADPSGKGTAPAQKDTGPPPPRNLTPEQQQVVEALGEGGCLHLDALTRSLGWDSGGASRVLSVLEVQGVVRQLPGMYYRLA